MLSPSRKEVIMFDSVYGVISLSLFTLFIVSAYATRFNFFTKSLNLFLGTLWLVLSVAHLASDYFTGNGIDEAAVYHLWYRLEGAGFLEYSKIIFISSSILLLLLFTLFKVCGAVSMQKLRGIFALLPLALLLISLAVNPAIHDVARLSSVQWKSPEASDFDLYYKSPVITATNAKKKNLVFVYAESLERTYLDESLFPGLMPGINELQGLSTSFTDIRQLRGTGWTIGGITASQCGIPLITPSHGNSMSGLEGFLSGATCFGDVMRAFGYQFNFIGGANLNFGGKGKFFKSHGFERVEGKLELKDKLKVGGYLSWWGLYDDVVFDYAFGRFEKLSEADAPFGLFTLTLDTHHPKGHPSRRCKGMKYADGENEILNSIKCADLLISEFIKKIKTSKYAKDTIVVLMSDHLAMRNTAFDQLKRGKRRNTFMIFNFEDLKKQKIDITGSTLDVGSTVLPFIGYQGNIGLGRDLLREKSEYFTQVREKLHTWDEDILKFWEFPTVKGRTAINWNSKTLSLGGQNINLPVLLEIRPNLTTVARFQFSRSKYHKTFSHHINELAESSHFALFESCKNIAKIQPKAPKGEYCVLSGKNIEDAKATQMGIISKFTAKEFRALIGMGS